MADEEAFAKRLERYGRAHKRTLEMSSYLRDLVEPMAADRAGQLACCGRLLEFRQYPRLAKTRLHAGRFCQLDKLCPLCAIRRGAKRLRRYVDRVASVLDEAPDLRPHLVTHTVVNGEDLGERFEHLTQALRLSAMRRRLARTRGRRSAWAAAAGIAYSIEVKRGRYSHKFHPHSHGVWLLPASVDAAELQASLRVEWHELTQGEASTYSPEDLQVHVKPFDYVAAGIEPTADAIAGDLVEVFKYALKFSEMTPADTWLASKVLRGRRLVGSLGNLYGVPEPADLLDEPVADDEPFVRLLCSYVGGKSPRYVVDREVK